MRTKTIEERIELYGKQILLSKKAGKLDEAMLFQKGLDNLLNKQAQKKNVEKPIEKPAITEAKEPTQPRAIIQEEVKPVVVSDKKLVTQIKQFENEQLLNDFLSENTDIEIVSIIPSANGFFVLQFKTDKPNFQ